MTDGPEYVDDVASTVKFIDSVDDGEGGLDASRLELTEIPLDATRRILMMRRKRRRRRGNENEAVADVDFE